jgi:nucleotide-binding universal stress UspA family protein
MTTRTTVLTCIDGSRHSAAVVDYSSWVSATVRSPLKLLHNLESHRANRIDLSGNIGLGTRENLLEELTELEAKANRIRMEQGRLMLEAAQERANEHGAFDSSTLQRHGTLVESLIEMEEEIRVLVIGVRGEDHEEAENQLGAQLEAVIRSMHRPVLVVNRDFTSAPQNIMLAYDGSEGARKGLDMIASSPLFRGMHCHLVRVAHGSQSLEDEPQLTQTLQAAGLDVTTVELTGDVGPALLSYQREHAVDMTVMGAFGHSRLRELLFGSTTVKMLCGSTVPLLLLR